MSESSSDTESSCGWTVISNEGSDIEALVPDNVEECEDVEVSHDPHTPAAICGEESLGETSLDLTLRETTLEAEPVQEVGADVGAEDHVTLCSPSENSDIITLANVREVETEGWEEPVAKEAEEGGSELYLRTSASSQSMFREAETIFPADQPEQRDAGSSSSEDEEAEMKISPVVRRRRVRRSTAGSEPGDLQETHRRHEEVLEELQVHPDLQSSAQHHSEISSTLIRCVLLALLITVSVSFGYFCGKEQIREGQRIVEMKRSNELEVPCEISVDLQAQRQDLYKKLAQAKREMETQKKDLTTENQQLKITLEREEASLSALQEELRYLHAQIQELEERGAETDTILSENQRLKKHLQEEKQKVRSFMSQRETHVAEAQLLEKELKKERKITDKLREELQEMSLNIFNDDDDDKEAQMDPETEKLQTQVLELESKLKFEQQRSDLWERLYVESKEERAKGDRDVKPKILKDGMMKKVKETFNAVKNSTKEFVHHHKEQIKKAKEAVKENLLKFSDSVKSTFRHFKDSASRAFNRGKRSQERKDARPEHQTYQQDGFKEQGNKRAEDDHWQPQKHRHPHKFTMDSPHSERHRRKPGAQRKQCTMGHQTTRKGCSGVFDCAYEESMSLFNKAMEPIRADEFHELLRSYLHKVIGHFHHWRELRSFIDKFFQDGVFIHDRMLFTDFVSGVEDYLEEMARYHSLDDDVFEDLDDYIYRHVFGDAYLKHFGPSRPLERPGSKVKAWRHCQGQQRKHQQPRPRPQRAKKLIQPGRDPSRQFADVKIELGPMPFDPKY